MPSRHGFVMLITAKSSRQLQHWQSLLSDSVSLTEFSLSYSNSGQVSQQQVWDFWSRRKTQSQVPILKFTYIYSYTLLPLHRITEIKHQLQNAHSDKLFHGSNSTSKTKFLDFSVTTPQEMFLDCLRHDKHILGNLLLTVEYCSSWCLFIIFHDNWQNFHDLSLTSSSPDFSESGNLVRRK